MYYDLTDVIKNLQTLTVNDSAFNVLKDFERVLDELNVYVFDNWEDGEILAGPDVDRYMVTCKIMWPLKHVPDPEGSLRLVDYGCKIFYEKSHILIPRKVRKPDDFRPNTKKGKLDAHPVWIVTVMMPKKLISDIYHGAENRINRLTAEKYKNYQDNMITSSANVQDEDQSANLPNPQMPTQSPSAPPA